MLELEDHEQIWAPGAVSGFALLSRGQLGSECQMMDFLPTPFRGAPKGPRQLPDRPRQRGPGQFEELPLLGLVLAEDADFAGVLGASELRTLPQGSVGAFASGIFLSDSL